MAARTAKKKPTKRKRKANEKHPGGRPTTYNALYHPRWVTALVKNGATIPEIAEEMGVDRATIFRWSNKHPEFCDSLKIPKEEANERVVRSLFERALGYTHDEVDIRVCNGVVVKTPIKKHYPPDTSAAIFWLTNRCRDQWKRNGLSEGGEINPLSELLSQLGKSAALVPPGAIKPTNEPEGNDDED